MSGLEAEKVVVPIDFSEESLAAIDDAIRIAGEPKNVHVVHVLPELNISEAGVIWHTIDNDNRIEHARQALRERLPDARYRDLQVHVEIGDPGHRIAECAQRLGADLIVTPSHGRRGISRLLIGSVAERVVRLAHCPVLVLRK